MKLSIITVVYNGEAFIGDCIESVLAQQDVDLEYIVIDGGSTDNTAMIISRFADKIDQFVSEPDKGIYDAMNKGISWATGDVVGILNSDDLYANPKVLKNVLETFATTSSDLIYGDISFFKENPSKSERIWIAGEQRSFRKTWHPPHPGLFVRKTVYEEYGSFDPGFRLAGDFEFMLRVFHRYHLSSSYLPQIMVNMRLGGSSTSSVKSVLAGMREISRAFKVNGERVPIFYFVQRYLSKLIQLKIFSKGV